MPRVLLVACLAWLLPVAAARAQVEGSTAELRALAGPSYVGALQTLDSGQDASVAGFGAGFEFALGLPVTDDLAVGADLVLVRSGAAEHGVLSSTTFTALHLGAGVTYWITSSDLFLAVSLGLARSSVEGDKLRLGIELPDDDPSDLGMGVHAAFGKQFRVTDRFGLGASLSLLASFANNPIGGEDGVRTVLAATLGLSASLH